MAYPHAIIRDFGKGWDSSDLPAEDTDNGFFQLQMPGYSRPYLVTGALFPQLRNLLVTNQGRLTLRGGMHAATADLGAAPQGLTRYQNASLQRLLVAVGGSVLSINETGGAQATLSTGQSATAPIDFAQFYDRAFWCDGSKAPQKWDGVTAASQRMGIAAPATAPTATATAPTLAPPSTTPTVALSSYTLDPITGGTWAADTLTGSQSNRLPNPDFYTGGQYSAPNPGNPTGKLPTGWTGGGASPDLYGQGCTYQGPDAHGQTGAWLLCDTPNDYLYTTARLLNDAVATDASRYASQFYGGLSLFQSDTSGQSSVFMTVIAYSDAGGTAEIGRQAVEFKTPYAANSDAVYYDAEFSFAAYASQVLSYRVQLQNGPQNVSPSGAGNSLYVSQPVCFPFAAALVAADNGGQVQVQQPNTLSMTGGPQAASNPGTVGRGRGAGGVHLTRDYGTAQNWSGSNRVTLGLSRAVGVTGLTLRLGLRQSGSATRYYSNPFTLAADGSGATCDISTIPLAVRQAFRYAEIVLGGDFSVPATNGSDVFWFGPLTGAGNLSVGYQPYSYAATEIDAHLNPSTFAGAVQSNGSPVSATVAPTAQQAEAAVSLGTALANAATTHRAVYRYGGVFNDNPAQARLVAVVPIGTDVAYGADARNPNYSWNHTTGVLTDNTPDSALNAAGAVLPASGALLSRVSGGNLDNSFAGGLPYQYYATFVNAAGTESNPSPVSAGLSVAGTSAQVGGIPVSADPQVSARNLYRVGGTVTVPRFLATLANNTATTYVDNTADAALSLTALSFTHDPPLAAMSFFYLHKNRIVGAGDVANPYRLYLSSYGLPEYWPTFENNLAIDGGYIDVDPTFGDGIVGFCGTGSLLVIAKANSMHVLLGDSFQDFVVRKVASYGCAARRSLVRCKNQVLFLGPDGMVYALADDEPTPVALPIETTLTALTRAELAGACADYINQRYVLFVPRASGQTPVNVCYDFRVQAWTDLSDPTLGATATYAAKGQETNSELLLATKPGYVNPAGAAYNGVMSAFSPADAGATPISVAWETPAFEFGRPTYTKRGKTLKLEGLCQFPGAAPVATVYAKTPGQPTTSYTFPLSASAAGGRLLETNLPPDVIGRQLSVVVTGTVTQFELNTLDLGWVYLRERC